MTDALQIYAAILPVFLTIVIGLLLRVFRVLPADMDRGLLTLVVHVLMPCLILDKMIGNPLLKEWRIIVISAGTGFVVVAASVLIALWVGRAARMKSGAGLRSFALGTGVQNYGYMAIPVLVALFPGSNVLGVLFTHSLGVDLAVWTVGMMVLTGSARCSLRMVVSGPVVAILFGLVLAWMDWGKWIPSAGAAVIHSLGECGIPVALILVGVTVADMMRTTEWSLKVLVIGGVLRLGVLPLLYIAAAYLARDFTVVAQVFVVQAAMPVGNFAIVMARHFGGKPDVPIQLVLVSTAGAVITMPLWLALGSDLIS